MSCIEFEARESVRQCLLYDMVVRLAALGLRTVFESPCACTVVSIDLSACV